MKFVNVLLAILVSLLMVALVLEGGLRLIGFGPPNTGLQFDSKLGWALRPDHSFVNKSADFRVELETDAHGLRDDYHGDAKKPEGTYRVLCLGDSFTLGYTVAREDLFVDMLEHWWQAEGRKVEVINAGVQAYSTDQQLAWLEEHGAKWAPDLVLMFAFENDLYWNLKDSYTGSAKPVYDDHGARVPGELQDRMTRSFLQRTAIGNKLLRREAPFDRIPVIGTERTITAEQAVLLVSPPTIVADAERRTSAIFHQAGATARKLGAQLVVCPIPSRSQVDERYATEVMGADKLKLPRESWDPALPYAMLKRAASTGADVVLDPLPVIQAAQKAGAAQYHRVDWHLSPAGNRTLAEFLHNALDERAFLPEKAATVALADPPARKGGLPGWLPVFGVLWVLLGTLYTRTYRDEPAVLAFLKVGGLLALIFTIAIGGTTLIAMLPPMIAKIVLVAVILTILGFVAYKLGDRLGTAAELLKSFTLRGHWYLMPLLAVLVTIGSLLVVAASSPLVAPFIYTLF
jgi:lysophospholipase L1-like esterase